MKIKNKKAYFNYEVLDSFEAGIVLTGSEVKSFRKGRVNLGNAYVNIINGELWLIGADIAKYEFSNDDFYDPTRSRKLLVKKRELINIVSKMQQKNLTLVPVSMYLSGKKIKIEVAFARGKRDYDKKERIKERELDMDLHRQKRKYEV
jgi:SsrA-binding protein